MNTIIEKIKSWVNQRIDMWSKNREEMIKQECYTLADDSTCRIGELTDLLSRLSDLEKEEKPSDGLEEEILNSYDGSLHERWTKCPYTIFQDIARHFYELGRQSNPTTAEGLEEEIERMVKCEEEFMNFQCRSQLIGYMARHFAQWGAEHLKK